MINPVGILQPLAALLLAPLLIGIVNRVKAFFAGRQGPPLLQLYYDLIKLCRKGAVYSRTGTWIFRIAPALGLAAVTVSLALVPCGGAGAFVSFEGDLLLLVYLLGLARFFMVLAALDTGSAFGGMGASRELQFAALAEPSFLLPLLALALRTGAVSLGAIFQKLDPLRWGDRPDIPFLAACAWFGVMLAENARIPVDDPNTHLELTMIHEAMVLDNSGPELAFALYTAALKLWLFGALLVNLTLPAGDGPLAAAGVFIPGMLAVAVAVGVVESIMARLRLRQVAKLLIGTGAIAGLSFILSIGIE